MKKLPCIRCFVHVNLSRVWLVSKILTKSFTTILSQFPIKIANFLILGKPLVFLMVSGGIKKLKIKLLNNFL